MPEKKSKSERKLDKLESIVLGGWCFWCTEAVFLMLKGVEKVSSGYSGGAIPNPTYEIVSTGLSGHAEANMIEYDPKKISLETILDVFFEMHDPTSLNRQGADVGTQYRSAIFYTSDKQKNQVEKYIKKRQKDFEQPIVTELKKLEKYYMAESYHQNYYASNQSQPYCRVVISPKLEKLKKEFKKQLK